MKLNTAQAEAVARLESNSDFQLLMEAMNAYRIELLECTMFGKEDTVLTFRGMARSQTEVLRALGGARDFLRTRR